jgi:3-phenylpropionate/trans-cinnamate dioxygenase ferredoxin component
MTAPVARFSELPDGAATRVVVDGVPVCLVRRGDGVKAVHDTCSHQQWSLAEGLVWDNGIECSLHGSTFDRDTGAPSSMPATHAIPTFRVDVDGDGVHVDVTTATNGARFPDH